jgi:O-antigen ligase
LYSFNKKLLVQYAVFSFVLSILIVEFPRSFAFIPGVSFLLVLACRKFYGDWQSYRIPVALYVPFIVLGALASASLLWSISFETSLDRVLKMTPILFAGVVTLSGAVHSKPEHIRIYLAALLFALISGCLLVVFELNTGDIIHRVLHHIPENIDVASAAYNRGTNIIVLSCFSVLAYYRYIAQQPRLLVPLLFALLGLMVFTDSQSAQLALALGLVTFFAFPYRVKLCWYGLMVLVFVLTLGAPFIAPWLYGHAAYINALPFLGGGMGYAGPRLEIWDYISRYILESPITGYGIEATRTITDFDSKEVFLTGNTILHPHNFALQFWIEFGMVGALIAASGLVWLVWLIHKLDNHVAQRTALASFIAILSVSAMGYGMWQSWWMGAVFLTAAHTVFIQRLMTQKAEK